MSTRRKSCEGRALHRTGQNKTETSDSSLRVCFGPGQVVVSQSLMLGRIIIIVRFSVRRICDQISLLYSALQ